MKGIDEFIKQQFILRYGKATYSKIIQAVVAYNQYRIIRLAFAI